MEAIKSEVRKVINSSFVREEQHSDWVADIVPVAEKNGKIQIVWTFVIWTAVVLKRSSVSHSWIS